MDRVTGCDKSVAIIFNKNPRYLLAIEPIEETQFTAGSEVDALKWIVK